MHAPPKSTLNKDVFRLYIEPESYLFENLLECVRNRRLKYINTGRNRSQRLFGVTTYNQLYLGGHIFN